ncbi:MAG TPA: hypothetical protein PLM92_02365 [Bacillota bacterium]|nr:hypothetical protein [Bacillota bacterium]
MDNANRVERRNKKVMRLLVVFLSIAVVVAGAFLIMGAYKNQNRIEQIIAKADKLQRGYFYEKAIDVLKEDKSIYDPHDQDDPVTQKINEIKKAEEDLVKYDGFVEHIFFHSLIVYPQLAFDDKGHPAIGYNAWMTTADEFKKMLPLLQERGYILYPIEEVCDIDKETGKVTKKDIYLPKGKKPLIISIDDVDYYDYMKQDGFASRLVVDKSGKVATEVKTPEGKTEITYDGDVMPILDRYVEKNPEFSWQGYKGIVATTGYQGVFGYRITDGLPKTDEWRQEVKEISKALRESGWDIACHSYTHDGYLKDADVSLGSMKSDIDRWKSNIEPYVGETAIYISPYGFQYMSGSTAHRYIVDSGFHIFCPVSNIRKLSFYKDVMVSPRVNMDGYKMMLAPDEVNEYYFDVDKVLDDARPPFDAGSLV